MAKPKIVKIVSTRNIGRHGSDYDIEQVIGVDESGKRWNFIAHKSIKSGKVIDTFDYREMV